MKKFFIFIFVPIFMLLAGCSLIQKSDVNLENVISSGSVVSTGIFEEENNFDSGVVNTGKFIDIGVQNNIDLNIDNNEQEDDCTGNICSLKKINTGNINTGEVEVQVEKIKNILDKYADQITGDELDDTDIEIMYQIIDVLTSKK